MENAPSAGSFEAWMDAIVRGDAIAFGKFYDDYKLRLYRMALILTRGDEDLAKEVHQVTMIKAARRFKRFQAEREIWPWLAQIARNCYVDHVRKESLISRLRTFLKLDGERNEGKAVDESAIFDCLERAMAGLSAEDAMLLNAAYFDEKSQKKIAADLAKSPKAVERRLSRIRESLRENLLKELKNE
jgi:RNA polymerase sigma factor (sigma-70 family)